MSTDSSVPAPADFEAALKELETLVASMEAGKLSLEESLAAHKRGLALARFCQNTLSQAEQQVRVLEDDDFQPLRDADARNE